MQPLQQRDTIDKFSYFGLGSQAQQPQPVQAYQSQMPYHSQYQQPYQSQSQY